jgi:hypothetical protein
MTPAHAPRDFAQEARSRKVLALSDAIIMGLIATVNRADDKFWEDASRSAGVTLPSITSQVQVTDRLRMLRRVNKEIGPHA